MKGTRSPASLSGQLAGKVRAGKDQRAEGILDANVLDIGRIGCIGFSKGSGFRVYSSESGVQDVGFGI